VTVAGWRTLERANQVESTGDSRWVRSRGLEEVLEGRRL